MHSSISLFSFFKIFRESFATTGLVFLLCLDDRSEETSIVNYAQYDWAKTYVLPFSFWGDIYFYTDILQNLLLASNYSTEWIGSMPSSSSHKVVDDWNVIWMHKMLSDPSLISNGVDVLVFGNSLDKNRPEADSLGFDHSMWMDLVDLTLEHVGEHQKNASTVIHVVTHNYKKFSGMAFVARPLLISQFIDWISTVVEFIESDRRVLLILSKRTSCQEIKIAVQGFIYDFLVPYFFITHSNRIMTMSKYKTLKRSAALAENEKIANELISGIKASFSRYVYMLNSVFCGKASWINGTLIRCNRFAYFDTQFSEPDGNPMLFVLCHNKDTCDQASEQFSYYSWSQYTYLMPSTNLFETYFYTNIIENLIEVVNQSTSWVGSISWKASTKTYVHVIDRMLSDESLMQDGVDVIGFWTPSEFDPKYCNSTVYLQSNGAHPGIFQFIKYILKGVGESEENISLLRQPYPQFKSFYGSYFVARPALMQEYIVWIRRVMVFLGKDPFARTYIWSDSKYGGDMTVPLKVYGLSFYPLHPFIGERLVQYFFNSRNTTIVLLLEYMKTHDIEIGDYYYECTWWLDIKYN